MNAMMTTDSTPRGPFTGALRVGALALAAALALPATAVAQGGGSAPPRGEKPGEKKEAPQPAKQDDGDTEIDDLNPFRRPERGGPEAEMRELFLKVDKRLKRVTELLFEASAGDMSGAGDIGSARIDELIREAESQAGGARNDIAKLLEASRAQSSAASEEIGRILKLAEQNPQGSGGGSGQPPPQGDQQGQPQQGQTPQGSRREDKGETGPDGQQRQDQQGQDQQQGEQGQDQPRDRDGDGKPDGPQESNADPDQRSGEDPPESETADPANAAGNEDWGDLPVHLRKVFENSVNDEVPARYRDWVDSYYRRLNRRSGR